VEKRLLDYDPLTRTSTFHHYDDLTKETVIEEIQDVEHFLESNRRTQTHDVGGAKGLNEYSRKGIAKGWWHVATIPNTVILKWKRDYGVDVFDKNHTQGIKRLLNDPEWRYLRTGTGRV
jgi:hypothetical protein